jgi:hypothetical protein
MCQHWTWALGLSAFLLFAGRHPFLRRANPFLYDAGRGPGPAKTDRYFVEVDAKGFRRKERK